MSDARKVLYVAQQRCPTPLLRRLADAGWQVVQVRSLKAAHAALRQHAVGVALVRVPEAIGPAAAPHLESCLRASADCDWVSIGNAGEGDPACQQLMARHFLAHHGAEEEPEYICRTLEWGYQRSIARERPQPVPVDHGLGMVGTSVAMQQLRRMVVKAAATDAPVLISGESGAGKELVAQALHACSRRAQGPFVAVNCGGLSPSLIHSELFGHERGSFTGAVAERRGLIESAAGGTLFLDEVAELPLDLQATLLRFLQDRKVQRVGSARTVTADVRVIAASHVDLADAAAAGRFREDLFYRLNVVPIALPPLRERPVDIPLLANHFLERCCGQERSRRFSHAALEAMRKYPWPGNVRELYNRVQRAVVMAEGQEITAADLGLKAEPSPGTDSLESARVEAERIAVATSLQRACQNVALAARELGVSRMTMYRLMAKHSIGNDRTVT